MRKQFAHGGLVLFLLLSVSALGAEGTPLDRNLRPLVPVVAPGDEIPGVFKDMGVVQRKAMNKSEKLLLSNYVAMDFSDGPYSMYAMNMDIGYALSDFWEVYLNLSPFFVNSKRSIVKKVEALELAGGEQATISSALAKNQYGVQLLWAPLYGKDSFGVKRIIRSDTFFKVGVSRINYDVGSGMKYQLGVGKTYFLGRRTGLRVTANASYVETIIDNVKNLTPMAMLETGVIFYLL